MCVFVAVTVAGYRGDAARPFRERQFVAEPLSAEFGAPMPTDDSTLSITDGHCACALFAGTLAKEEFDAGNERRRYERKGWSQAKIERAIEAKRIAHERPGRSGDDAAAFKAAVEEIAITSARVSLLASDWDSSFHVSAHSRLALGDFVSNRGLFPQNTLVIIDV